MGFRSNHLAVRLHFMQFRKRVEEIRQDTFR